MRKETSSSIMPVFVLTAIYILAVHGKADGQMANPSQFDEKGLVASEAAVDKAVKDCLASNKGAPLLLTGYWDGRYTVWTSPSTAYSFTGAEKCKKRFDGRFADRRQNAKWTYWHENGQKAFEGKYVLGKKEGKWNSWDEKGNPAGSATYRRDARVK